MDHLDAALEASSEAERKFHIRHAQQIAIRLFEE